MSTAKSQSDLRDLRATAFGGTFHSPFADRGGFAFHHRPRVAFDASGALAPEAEFKQAVAGLKKATDDVKTFAETANAEIKNLGRVTGETKLNADKALSEMGTLTTRITDLEQKMSRRGGPAVETERKSLGQHVVESDALKARLPNSGAKGTFNLSIETKNITSAPSTWGTGVSPSSSLVVADRRELVPLPMRTMTIRSLIAPGTTVSNNIEYAVQTGRYNNAAVVAEGAVKPYSNYTWDLKAFPVRTIAHLVKASRQILDDAPALQSILDAEMRYGLAFAEEAELLYGDGTGQHLLGIMPQATPYAPAFTVTGETAIDRLRLAMLQGVLALYPMSGIVLHPTDWTKIEMVKDGMGRYLVGDPQGRIQPLLWGLPVVPSLAMAVTAFLVGAFEYGAQIFDRMAVEVLISTENVDDFERNLLSIRAEERLALVVKRPLAFISGTLPSSP